MSSQTQCPHCQTIYPMPTAKMGDPNARAKCGKCQQVFFLNANILQAGGAPVTNSPAQPVATKAPEQPRVSPQVAPQQQATRPAETVIPTSRKRVKPTPTEGMIHDEMDGVENDVAPPAAEVTFSDAELDNFLNENISFAPRVNKSTKDEIADNEDEAWLKDLLNDTKPVNNGEIANTSSPIINNVDLSAVIPAATPKPKKPISVKKAQPDKPTTQQIATKKSLGPQLFWLLGCVLLVGLLTLQYALFNLDKLAKNPETAGLARTICGIAPCKVPTADLNSFSIDSQLQNQKDVIITINNKSSEEQLFPYLLVQFKDKNGAVVADFVADTKDYLSESQTTLLANQHKRIMLSASTKPNNASSVTVTPFY